MLDPEGPIVQDKATISVLPPEPTVKPLWSSDERSVRAVLAFSAMGLLAILMLGAIWSSSASWTDTKEMLQILTPIVTLVLGSILGFYYGTTTNTK